MSAAWLAVLCVGVLTVAIKSAGTVALGRRELPAPAARVIALLAPSVLAALVATQTLGSGQRLVLDARAAGVAAATVALAVRVPLVASVAVAAAVTALLRLV